MSTHEHLGEIPPSDEQRSDYADDVVQQLKLAAIALGAAPTWLSQDGSASYMATPLTLRDDQPISDNQHIPYVELSPFSDYARDQFLNTWVIDAVENIGDSDEVTARQYFVNQGGAIVREIPVSKRTFKKDDQARFLQTAFESDANAAQPKVALVRDYAAMDNALFDLKAHIESRDHLPREELRNIRTERRFMLRGTRATESILETATEPKWWKITYSFTRLYAIRAATAEDAILDLEEFFGMKTETLEESAIEYDIIPFQGSEQAEIAARYGYQRLVRLMPYSTVEYTHDIEHATPEQKKAFEQALRLLGGDKWTVLG